MFCAISGVPPTVPVVSIKSGYVYERDIILKYLRDNGNKDPVTGDELNEEDLVQVKPGPSPAPARTASHTSVPALIRSLQDEWDTSMLEMLAVRKDAERMRQELSNALYKEDAAMRVLARTLKERDEAREALENIQSSLGLKPTASGPAAAAGDSEMAVDSAEKLPVDTEKRVNETKDSLSATRKKRKVPPGYASQDDVRSYAQVNEVKSMHAAKPPGVTCLDVSTDGQLVLTGGADKNVQVYDRSSEKVVATAKGHTKRITAAYFIKSDNSESSGLPPYIVSSSEDSSIRIWAAPASGKKTFSATASVNIHSAKVTGLSLHPSKTLLASSSADGTFALYDIIDPNAPKTLLQLALSPVTEGVDVQGATSVAFHPDGALVAIGGGDGHVRIFDVLTLQIAACFKQDSSSSTHGAAEFLSFSENGYLLASASSIRGQPVLIWDLRKMNVSKAIPGDEDRQVQALSFDPSAQFLAVVGSDCKVYANKTWEQLMVWDENSAELTGACWAKEGSELIMSGMDRTLRILGKASS